MKKTAMIAAILLMTFAASAIVEMIFTDYNELENRSTDVIVVRCATNPPTLLHIGDDPQINTYSIEVIAVLKGTNLSRSVSLVSEQWLNQGDNYLVFGNCDNGVCRAIEDFRVVHLGRELYPGALTNAIAGKSPDEQLQLLFKRAVDNLNRQISKDQEEKQRLETAIK